MDSVEDALYWRMERLSFAAAYGNERVPALMFIPRNASAPYQTIVYFPGGNAFMENAEIGKGEGETAWFAFLVRSGRALLFPMYKGTYTRFIGDITQPNVWQEMLIHSAKDLQRGVEYLRTRPDFDHESLAYFSLSMGGGAGPIMTALESRFKASVLLASGLYFWRRSPQAEPFNFLPRVKVPTPMLNGGHDFYFPVETSQNPMFDLLGTPPADKRHRVFPNSGHIPADSAEVMKETLDWLDRYLGPVKAQK